MTSNAHNRPTNRPNRSTQSHPAAVVRPMTLNRNLNRNLNLNLGVPLPLVLIIVLAFTGSVAPLHASVSWDTYILRVEREMVFIKSGADIALTCHISRLAIINDQLIVEYGGEIFKTPVTAQTKIAIMHEIERSWTNVDKTTTGKSGDNEANTNKPFTDRR